MQSRKLRGLLSVTPTGPWFQLPLASCCNTTIRLYTDGCWLAASSHPKGIMKPPGRLEFEPCRVLTRVVQSSLRDQFPFALVPSGRVNSGSGGRFGRTRKFWRNDQLYRNRGISRVLSIVPWGLASNEISPMHIHCRLLRGLYWDQES